MEFKTTFKKVAFLSTLLVSSMGFAKEFEENQTYFGPVAGINVPNGGTNFGSSNAFTFGLTVGHKFVPQFGVAFYGTTYGQSNSASIYGLNAGASTWTYNLMAQANFFFSYLHVGGEVGATINTWGANLGTAGASTSNASIVFGPEIGVDFPVLPLFSIGADVHYLFNGFSTTQNNLQALANVKFWL